MALRREVCSFALAAPSLKMRWSSIRIRAVLIKFFFICSNYPFNKHIDNSPAPRAELECASWRKLNF